MKKAKILILIFLVITSIFGGCTRSVEPKSADTGTTSDNETKSQEEEQEKPPSQTSDEVPQAYDDLLEEYHRFILTYDYNSDFDNEEIDESKIAVWEKMLVLDREMILKEVGYHMMDINEDGIPELFIGDVENQNGSDEIGNIYALFTLKNELPQLLLVGDQRNKYFYLDDAEFVNISTVGVLYSMDLFKLSKDELEPQDSSLYFSQYKESGGEEVGYYHSLAGNYDINNAEELDKERFDAQTSDLIRRIKAIEYTPFSQRKIGADALITIRPSTDYELDYLFDYDSFGTEDENRPSRITIQTVVGLKNFKLLDLTDGSVGEDGTYKFNEKVIYELDYLDPNRPFIVGVAFYGSIPNNGFSYVDEEGKEHKFMIFESGLDDSISFKEYE